MNFILGKAPFQFFKNACRPTKPSKLSDKIRVEIRGEYILHPVSTFNQLGFDVFLEMGGPFSESPVTEHLIMNVGLDVIFHKGKIRL